MAVDSTLELYTTLFGWLFYNSIWDVLVATGIVFLPFLGILLDTIIRSYAGEDAEEAGNTTLRIVEVEFFVAFFVILIAAVPATPLNAVDLSFTPRAVIGTPAQPVATVNNSRTTYGGGISFNAAPVTVNVPVFWYAVMSFSSGFNRAVMEDVPPTLDFRGYVDELRDASIQDPNLQHEINDFFRDCFVEARSKYLAERPSSAAITALLNSYGESDPDWIGSHVYQEIPGYYDSIRADTVREGYPWSALRDVEWDATNHPVYGKPFCSEWWLGIQQSILSEQGDLDLLSAAAEPGWDPAPRRDAVIQIALINSPPRWTTRGYDFAYGNLVDFSVGEPGVMVSVQNAAQQGLAAYGLGKTSVSFAAYLRVFLEAAPMVQALILMGLYTLLPFFILISRYKFSLLIIGALILFTVKFWTVLWFFAWWVDQNLIQAFYPDPGSVTTLFSTDLTLKRIILNFLTGGLYLVLPLLLSVYLGLAGIRVASQLDGATQAITRGTAGAGRINPRLAGRLKGKKAAGK
ncbi:MAG: conjugal transfer protein TraG [Cellvibrionaceae bacterium]|nr:conjugal transfer protein TraG [Cellvibrionaceae bacterium]MBN57965.1 conjugal transfer protein TraG [Oceanospirillaceae bacterium]|tara:strand:+ start:32368 stop:33924 length:1557 start_codon:yes stop_codon:yes gene_type:complete